MSDDTDVFLVVPAVKGRTMSQWEEINAKRKQLAESKRIVYPTVHEWHEHNQSCSNCQVQQSPYTLCKESMELHGRLAPTDWNKLPEMECLNCHEKWEEECEEGPPGEGEFLVCPACAFKHKVVAVDYTVEVEVEATGEFEYTYLEVEE